ncbi:unnamed protein product [Haemonchus placei]|uniref:Sugar transporter SWEET1 n=1 Tax=Haemonchus placei TaxID=6290 RepID=A0A0N4WTV3_HAEPC|nr:unnamed protein product [Haemonchus placei]
MIAQAIKLVNLWCKKTLEEVGQPICIEILRRRTTQEISGVPFLMGLLGGAFWLRYGFLKDDSVMIIVNVVCISLFTVYCIFYLIFANNRVSFVFFFIFLKI